MSPPTPLAAESTPPPRHELYVPRFAMAKFGLALLGVLLLALSMDKFFPLAKLAATGGRARGEAIAIVRTDAAGQDTVYTSDAEVLAAVKKVEDTRDRQSVFRVEYRFKTAAGQVVETRAPLGQHVKPLQPLRDEDGLPSTNAVWYDLTTPHLIALPLQLGTWFMPGMLALFGVLGLFMGLTLWRHANQPIEMPDLSRSHAEQDAPAK